MRKKIKTEVKTGIWLDQQNAFITTITGKEDPVTLRVKSDVESRVRFKGEGKAFTRFGNTYMSDEERKQHRQQNQRKKFFKTIISNIRDADYLYLFGPGRAKMGLRNAIEKDKDVRGQVSLLETMDKMTVEEAAAATSKYFSGMAFKSFKRQLRYLKRLERVR